MTELAKELPELVLKYRDEFVGAGAHKRNPENLAKIYLSFCWFLKFARVSNAITDEELRFHEVIAKQMLIQSAEDRRCSISRPIRTAHLNSSSLLATRKEPPTATEALHRPLEGASIGRSASPSADWATATRRAVAPIDRTGRPVRRGGHFQPAGVVTFCDGGLPSASMGTSTKKKALKSVRNPEVANLLRVKTDANRARSGLPKRH